MDAGWRTRKRQTAKLRADERREDTRAAAGLGGGEGRGRTPANPGPPGGGDQSRYRYVSQRRRSEALGPSVALAAVKGAESEDPGGDFGSGTRGCLGAEAAASEGAVCPERGSLRGAGQEVSRQPGVAGARVGRAMVSGLEVVDESFGSPAAGAPAAPRKGSGRSNAGVPGAVGHRRFAQTSVF